MRIAIIGYGKMGKAVEAEALSRGHSISFVTDNPEDPVWEKLSTENTDVAIEFSMPASAIENFNRLIEKNIPVISGTTGWFEHIESVRKIVESGKGSFIYSSNFSPGVNILFRLNEMLAKLMNKFPDYDVYVSEEHHKNKKDAPGGTAISLAKGVIENSDRKKTWVSGELKDRPPRPEEISISFSRAGEITGRHVVTYTSAIDEISIRHEAFNRKGFAQGAILAAEWIKDKKGFFNFSEIFE